MPTYGYRNLSADKIIQTQDRLVSRITARFPNSGLARVSQEVLEVAREASARTRRLSAPNWWLRGLAAVMALVGLAAIWRLFALASQLKPSDDMASALQGLDAGVNLMLLAGAGLFFLANLSTRLARNRAAAALHELRSLIHVIDMHQLTKDPSALTGARTQASIERTMSPFEVKRYLDYCSEMLSICGKIAALYAQGLSDPVLIDAVGDIERLTTGLSQKIWQKITLLQGAPSGIGTVNTQQDPAT